MFYLNKNAILDVKILQKMIERFNLNDKAKREKYKNYYDGIQEILNKKYNDPTKPCIPQQRSYAARFPDFSPSGTVCASWARPNRLFVLKISIKVLYFR